MITYNGSIATGASGAWMVPPSTSAVIGGRTYPTADMPDGKTWLACNLDYAWAGLSVPTSDAYASSSQQAMYYDYDESTYGWDGYKCGLLYNWYAVDYLEQNKATLCPGWHVPSDQEWRALVTAAGGDLTAGAKLKASDVSWASSWGGTDDYGFAALPAGDFTVSFDHVGSLTHFWTATEHRSDFAYHWYIGRDSEQMYVGVEWDGRQFSVRLVKDTD